MRESYSEDVRHSVDESMAKHRVQDASYGYAECIVMKEEALQFLTDLTALGVDVTGISWWCHCELGGNKETGCPHGGGGPLGQYQVGWFSEMYQLPNAKFTRNEDIIQYLEFDWPSSKDYLPCLVPAFDLDVPEEWRHSLYDALDVNRVSYDLLRKSKRKGIRSVRVLLAILLAIVTLLSLSIGSIVIGSLLFPGLPYYLANKLTNKYLDLKMVEYTGYQAVATLDQPVDVHFFHLAIPSSLTTYSDTEESRIYMEQDKKRFVMIHKDRMNLTMDWADSLSESKRAQFSTEYWKEYGDFPNTVFEMNRLLFSLSSQDYRLMDSDQCKMLSVLAIEKNLVMEIQGGWTAAYWFDHGDLQGILTMNSPTLSHFEFIRKGVPAITYDMSFVGAFDRNVMEAVLNSIEFSDAASVDPTPTPSSGTIG